MAAYMKHRFSFLGLAAPVRRTAQRAFVATFASATSTELLDAAAACWAEPEREFQYVGADLLVRHASRLRSEDLEAVGQLITSKSWWDTVDALAPNVVGPMVAADASLVATMDRWVDNPDFWLARAAILHQLKYRANTDPQRLFNYVDRRSDDREFFVRKACGWALREYSKTDPDAVRSYVDSRGDRLSGLTRREALKRLT